MLPHSHSQALAPITSAWLNFISKYTHAIELYLLHQCSSMVDYTSRIIPIVRLSFVSCIATVVQSSVSSSHTSFTETYSLHYFLSCKHYSYTQPLASYHDQEASPSIKSKPLLTVNNDVDNSLIVSNLVP